MKKRLLALLLILVLLVPAGVASAATRYRVNTSSLKVRMMPSESAQVLASYRLDYVLTVQSTTDGWSYVKFTNGKEGYVQSKYIKKATTGSAWIARDDTSMRTGPGGDFIATAKLARGKKVSVLSWGSKYSYISAGDFGSGYVVNDLLSRTKVAASKESSKTMAVTGGNYDAWVLNAGYRKVNLRSDANTKAPVIAQYPTGTKVRVLEHSATWDKIQVDGNTGYMMTKFLSTSAPAVNDDPAPAPQPAVTTPYTAYVVSANGKPVNMRRGAGNYSVITGVPYGSPVTVMDHGAKWDKIEYGGKTGYMENRFLQLTQPANAPAPTEEPTTPSKASFSPYSATVSTPDGKSLNVHYKPDKSTSNVHGMGDNGRLPNGTTVTVIGVTGNWAEVEYGGKTGFVLQQYLK